MSEREFQFALEALRSSAGPWEAARVVSFEGVESLGALYRYELAVLVPPNAGGGVTTDDMIGARGTLRIATQSEPRFRYVHGVVTEAEEGDELPEGTTYRLVLEPPLARSRYRTRCRVFLDQPLEAVVRAVLAAEPALREGPGAPDGADQGDAFEPALERFELRVEDPARFRDPAANPYCVQYHESDLAFVSRLLEREGFAFHFENDAKHCVLVVADTDGGRPRLAAPDCGPGIDGREIARFRTGARLRPRSVEVGEYNWHNPALAMAARAERTGGDEELRVYEYPGTHHQSPAHGEPLARAIAERWATEARPASGSGSLRVLSAGTIFRLQHAKARYEGEHLVTSVRVRGSQAGVLAQGGDDARVPFEVSFEAARRGTADRVEPSRFRPARSTPRPKIVGLQTAFVMPDPSARDAEVNVGGPSNVGSTRVRFHWDSDDTRHSREATSNWVRSSQPFAGPGQGGVWHPRVGVESIVQYEDGDPDRPVIVGRLYNGKNRPPRTKPTDTTLWSLATPGAGVKNEISFEDEAGNERIYMNAGKDMQVVVGNDRTENVGADAFMNVGANNDEDVGSDQAVTVGANDTMSIGANLSKAIGASRLRLIGGLRSKTVGGNEKKTIGAVSTNLVGGDLSEKVGGTVQEKYGAARFLTVGGSLTEIFEATKTTTTAALTMIAVGGNHKVAVDGPRKVSVGAVMGNLVAGPIDNTYGGTHTVNVGALQICIAGTTITYDTPTMNIDAALHLKIRGATMEIYGHKDTRRVLDVKLVGRSMSAWGAKADAGVVRVVMSPAQIWAEGPHNENAGLILTPRGPDSKVAAVHLYAP